MVNPKSHFGNQFQAVRTRPPCASRSHQVMKKLGPTFAVAAGLLALIVGQFWVDGPPSTFAQTDTTAPTVSSVAITSDTGDDGVYGIGDKIEVTVTFSENVTLTGSPLLELTIGSSARNAAYKSTTGSKVVFSYTVAVGNSDVDGISIAADKLSLNGGTIKDAAENDADLSHSAVSALAGHKVDGIRPTITSVYLIGSSSGQDGVHTIGEYLPAGVRFSEHVYVGGYPGPRMKLNFEGATKSADFGGAYPECSKAICVDGPGGLYGISVEFEYMIAKGDLDLDGVAINANSVVLNGSSIRDGAGNDAVLSHSADAEDSNYIVDGVPATVRSVAITSDPGSDNTYGVGDTIEVNVTFSESVSVPRWFGSGGVVRMPRLELNIGGVTKSARTHERGNITGTALVFSYTVQDGDNDANGISIGANALTLKYGGTIRDANGTCCPGGNNADLTHSAVAESARHKVRTLTQPSKSSDATLSALILSGINIGTFASGTTSYTASVANSVTETTVTPTVNDSGASYVIKLGGVVDADRVIALDAGSNVITVEVTAEDDSTTKTYTVTVTRAAAPISAPDLVVPFVYISFSNPYGYSPSFTLGVNVKNQGSGASGSTTLRYYRSTDSAITSGDAEVGTDAVDGLAASEISRETIDLIAPSAPGTYYYGACVDAVSDESDTTNNCSGAIAWMVPAETSTDATLSALTLSGINFGAFSSATTSYTASVANSVSQTTVTPTVNDSGATYVIKLGGVTDADGMVSLSVGSNVITVQVSAEDDSTTKTYTVTVTRAEPPSTDATLSALTLSGIDFGTFASGTSSYTASVANSVTETTVTPTVNHSGATYVIKLGGVTDADGVVSLSVGSNVITVEVTAEDDETTQTYTVTVTRAAAPISAPDLDITFVYTFTNPYGYSPSFTLGVTVENQGSGASGPTTLRYYRSTDSAITSGDAEVGTDTVDGLAASESSRESIDLIAPSAPGTYYYGACVDAVPNESDATNNCSGSVAFTVPAETSTDATLSALTLSGINFGAFSSNTNSYTASVAYSVSQTTVTPTVNDSGATYVINLGGVTDADGVVSLSVGSNAITVEVTAEDDETTQTYTVTVTRAEPPSTDATLSGLTLSGIDFGTFASGTTSYSAQVANSVSQTTVTPTVNDSGATYVIKLGGVTDADGVVSLSVGSNVITVQVSAEDDTTTRTYTVTVTRAEPPSTDATLSALTLSDVPFGTFASGTTSYSAQVASSVSQTTVTPTVNDSGATYVIKLDGVEDADGVVSLAAGSNVITVVVTAEDDSTTKTYTVTVTRAEPPSTDATLSALTLSGIVFGTFDSTTTTYSAQVANSVSQTTVTPTVNDSGASYVIKLGGVTDADGVVLLSVGSNAITVEVTAEDDSTTKTYTVTVTRAEPPSTDATLSALTLSGIDFGTFASGTASYSAQVANSVSQTTVAPTVKHSGASYVIKLGGVTDADGVVSLSVGSNVITVEVTAEDGETTQTYTVTVTRAAPPSTDATLSALSLSGIEFGTFDSSTTTYSAQVANTVSQTTVTPTVNDSGASYVIKLGGMTNADGVVSLSVGSNVITVKVTAEDDDTTRTYTVTLTRAEPPSTDATLSALTLSGIDFGTFASGTASYSAQVASSVSQTTVTPTLNDSGASYVIKLDGVTDVDGVVSLNAGSNVITVEVSAEDDETTQTYTVTVSRAEPPTPELSDDATLSSLTLSGIDFGTFDSTTTSYTAQVANAVSQTTVTPTVNHAEANNVIKLGGVTDADGVVSLSLGTNAITVEVTAEDGETTHTYTVTVTRAAPPSTDATLSALSLSGIDLGTFASGTTSYSAQVANSVSQTTVTPTVNDSEASYVIKLGGATDADGVVSLSVGSNVITVEVTAEDENTTQAYTVTVTRAAPLSTDVTLSALTLSGVDFGTFDSSATTYTAQVANDVTHTTVTPTANHSGASYVVKLGGVEDKDSEISLAVGSNVITIEVTAEDDKTTQTYSVTVTRTAPPALDATLSALTLSGIDFGTFASGTNSYTAQVANSVSQTTVTPTVNHAEASYVIKLDGVTDADGVVLLSVGSNVITVEVTAEDDSTTQTYTVTVTRAAPESNRERLRNLYDSNDDGVIDRDETVAAIRDYFAGDLTRDETIEVIKLYFSSPT